MHRCYLDPAGWTSSSIDLAPEEAHHAANVLRLRPQDRVTVFDGAGREADAVVEQCLRGSRHQAAKVTLALDTTRQLPPPRLQVTLFQALPKGRKMDWIVEKSTELGMIALVPVITDHVIGAPKSPRQGQERCERWQKIALGAAKQSGTPRLPKIEKITPLATALTELKSFDLLLLAAIGTPAGSLRKHLAAVRGERPLRVALFIGPEGDFSKKELAYMQDIPGMKAISLGPRVLRVETAPLYLLSVLAYEAEPHRVQN